MSFRSNGSSCFWNARTICVVLDSVRDSLFVRACSDEADSMLGSAPPPLLFARRQVGTVQEGELFRIETLDWTGGQIGDNDSADDVKNIDLTQAHCLGFLSCSS